MSVPIQQRPPRSLRSLPPEGSNSRLGAALLREGAWPFTLRRGFREAAMAQRKHAPLVGVVMGSDSDWDIMRHAAAQLDAFGVAYEPRVVSAHRMPDDMFEYAEDAGPRGLRCIIAGAGGAAHLP